RGALLEQEETPLQAQAPAHWNAAAQPHAREAGVIQIARSWQLESARGTEHAKAFRRAGAGERRTDVIVVQEPKHVLHVEPTAQPGGLNFRAGNPVGWHDRAGAGRIDGRRRHWRTGGNDIPRRARNEVREGPSRRGGTIRQLLGTGASGSRQKEATE